MKHVLLVTLSVLSFVSNANELKPIYLSEALKKRLVVIDAVSTGGYQGRCLSLTLRNLAAEALHVNVDHALVFSPSDPAYQDLVVIGEEVLAMNGRSTATTVLQTFCGKSFARSPRPGLNYALGKTGDERMIRVARFIKEHGLYNYIGQSAMWTLTNNHRLSNIYSHGQSELSKKLVTMMAGMLGQKVPEFYTRHNLSDSGSHVFNPVVEEYVVEFHWTDPKPRNMHVTIHRANGEVYPKQFREVISAAGHKATVVLDPRVDPPGNYTVRLWDDENCIYRQVEVPVE